MDGFASMASSPAPPLPLPPAGQARAMLSSPSNPRSPPIPAPKKRVQRSDSRLTDSRSDSDSDDVLIVFSGVQINFTEIGLSVGRRERSERLTRWGAYTYLVKKAAIKKLAFRVAGGGGTSTYSLSIGAIASGSKEKEKEKEKEKVPKAGIEFFAQEQSFGDFFPPSKELYQILVNSSNERDEGCTEGGS